MDETYRQNVSTDMDADQMKGMVEEIADQDGTILIKVLCCRLTEEGIEDHGRYCSQCDAEMVEGQEAWMAGIPLGDTLEKVKTGGMITLPVFGSEQCCSEYITSWARQFDYEDLLIAYHS